ncbi:MAG: sigma 54-interacting transcriptional regulator, partial [Bradymonadia bacterium]
RTLFVYCRLEMGISSLGGFLNDTGSVVRLEAEDLARRAAGSALSILIQGPTGAGKERLAAKIHEWSGRGGKFVAVNCGAMPRELIASELFGHLKGSFSGASEHRSGLFQTAHEGTLFLDEVAELPLEVQATLLRVCESNEIRPVGADRAKVVDVRILTATHVDLDERVAKGTFREDLLARLRGVTCIVPPLKERRDEILHLFDTFSSGRSFGLTVAKRLLHAPWRENVRGVKKAAEQALLYQEESSSILPQHLPSFVSSCDLPEMEQPHESQPEIEALLRAARGNVAEVARKLGVHRQQVYRWITRANINPKDFRR